MAINGVLRPGHVAIRVREMDPAVRHYTEVLGLIETARDAQGRVFLKAWDEHDHHSVVLREAADPGMDYMGWRVDSIATLKKLAADLEASGLVSEMKWIPAGEHPMTGERFRFGIPTGHVMELFAEKEKVGNGMPLTNPDAWPDGLRGMAPSRFDHCLLYGDDLDGSVRLFIDVLGFALTEQVVAGPEKLMIGAFLTCSTKPHDVAFIRQPVKGKFHHASFVLDNWGDVLKAADIIAKKNVPLDIGPTRHGITRGETIYFFDPSGNRNEVFSGGYIQSSTTTASLTRNSYRCSPDRGFALPSSLCLALGHGRGGASTPGFAAKAEWPLWVQLKGPSPERAAMRRKRIPIAAGGGRIRHPSDRSHLLGFPKTAKALGLSVLPPLLAHADGFIE